jgi:hypothetical protein
MRGVATTATATSGATTITVASGTGISNGDSVYGVGIVPGTTVVSGGGTTSIVLDTAIVNTFSATPVTFNSTKTIVTPGDAGGGFVKAWAVVDYGVAGTWPGGASTVTRVAGSTTATITGANNHGLNVGSRVYVVSGVAAALYTVVSVPTPKTFTITTVATTALSAVVITFNVRGIINSYNIHSVVSPNGAASATGFYFNFITLAPVSDYVTSGTAYAGTSNLAFAMRTDARADTNASFGLYFTNGTSGVAPNSGPSSVMAIW